VSQSYEEPPGEDIFGADWPEDPRLTAEGSGPEEGPQAEPESTGRPTPSPAPPSTGPEFEHVRSAVKITRTTRGVTWEVRVMAGDPEILLNQTRELAVRQHKALEGEVG
jgi:hypothetical protein